MKPVFVINALSETVARKGSKLKPLCKNASKVFDTQIFDHLDEIVIAGIEAGWVIIEGGDGTVQGIITAFFNHIDAPSCMPRFTLLPGGMTNQVAKNIGLSPFSKNAIEALINNPENLTQMPLLRVSSFDHPDLFGFLFSTGGVPMVTEYTKNKLHSRGVGGSTAVVGGILKGVLNRNSSILHPTKVNLSFDDKILEGEHLGSIVTTLPSLLLGLDPFWGNGKGALRVTYVEANAKRLVSHIAGLWLGQKHRNRRPDGLHSYNTENLHYHYDGPVVLDGEPLTIGPEFSVSATQPLTFVS